MKRDNHGTPSLVIRGIKLRESGGNRVHLGLGRVHADSRLQACDDDVVMFSADGAIRISPRHRRPHLRVIRKAKRWRHHARNQAIAPVYRHIVPHNVAIGAEMFLPKSIAKDHDMRASWVILVRQKRSAQKGLHAQNLEKVGRHRGGVHLHRLGYIGQRESAVAVNRHLFEDVVLPFPIDIVSRRDSKAVDSRKALRGWNMPHSDQSRRISEPKRP